MAVVRPTLAASTMPSVVAPQQQRRRPRLNMLQPGFYAQQLAEPQREELEQSPPEQGAPVGEEVPSTEEQVREQFGRIRQLGPPPSLQPGARVKSPNMELVQPSNFAGFYEQLNAVGRIGQQQLATERAKQQFRQIQRLQDLMSQGPPGYQSPQLQQGGIGQQAYGAIPSNPRANFRHAQNLSSRYGWGQKEMSAWYTLGMKESGWNNNAQNPSSTAYGIGQFLDSTWGNYGFRKSSDPAYQVRAMAEYIRRRYGSPSKALAFHLRNNWY